jgi:hypothetical protein
VSQRTREDQVGRWRREPDSHLEGLKNDITNTVSGREPGGLTNDSSGRIANDCHGRRTEKCTRPRAGETHIPMCPPGNLGLRSPTSGGTVDTEPSPLDDRDHAYGIGEGMGHPGTTRGGYSWEYT